jgi:hypothetical protein
METLIKYCGAGQETKTYSLPKHSQKIRGLDVGRMSVVIDNGEAS